MIAFIGSVFSPYYAWARRRAAGGLADPLQHCAINIALYGLNGRGGHRWAMTERGAASVQRSARTLRIGPSALAWEGDTLVVHVDEVTAPWPSRLRGCVRLHAGTRACEPIALDAGGRHWWTPIAPKAHVEVAFDKPALQWSGPAYLDANAGSASLEADFKQWHWSRAHLPDNSTRVLYDVTRRDGSTQTLALQVDADGTLARVEVPPPAPLQRGFWGMPRLTRSDADAPVRVLQTLEDSPFYTRSLLSMQWSGQPVTAVHESLSLDRFAAPWVQAMLPFRMPRRTVR